MSNLKEVQAEEFRGDNQSAVQEEFHLESILVNALNSYFSLGFNSYGEYVEKVDDLMWKHISKKFVTTKDVKPF